MEKLNIRREGLLKGLILLVQTFKIGTKNA
jgi:hypothetical protein